MQNQRIDVTDRVDSSGPVTVVYESLPNRLGTANRPEQDLCVEMLHWDSVRPAPPAGTPAPPTMRSLFDPHFSDLFIFKTRGMKTDVACHEFLHRGLPDMDFCTEMLHWDDMNGNNAMRERFVPYVAQRTLYNRSAGRITSYNFCTVEAQTFERPTLTSTEMIHWEDWQASARAVPTAAAPALVSGTGGR